MKFFPLLCLLINLIPLTVTGLEVQVNFGFCASQESGQAILIVTGGEMPYTFQWSDPSLEGDEVYDLSPGTYSVTVNDATGCTAVETFEIPNQSSLFLDYAVFNITCRGFNDGQIFIDDFLPSDLKFGTDGINFSDQTFFENLVPGNFNLYVLESNGCITQEVINIVEPVEVLVDLGEDYEVALGAGVLLSPIFSASSNGFQLDWSSTDPNFEPCFGCSEVFVTPLETSTYTITASTVPGCSSSDEVTVYVSKEEAVFIPNVFTPNDDGINDRFVIYTGFSIEEIRKFIIRDNFGSIVFEASFFQGNDPSFGWDGTFKGKKLNPGTFIYHVKGEFVGGEIVDFFGTVNIVE